MKQGTAVTIVVVVAIALGLPKVLDSLQGNRAIHLRGRVIDRDGGGIGGIVVEAKITRRKRTGIPVPWGPTGQAYETIIKSTGHDGTFAIDSRGIRVVLGLRGGDGNRMPEIGSHPHHFDFSPSSPDPDPNAPLVYR